MDWQFTKEFTKQAFDEKEFLKAEAAACRELGSIRHAVKDVQIMTL